MAIDEEKSADLFEPMKASRPSTMLSGHEDTEEPIKRLVTDESP